MARPDRWSQERLDKLEALHAAGWNSQQIANELDTTRNTVLSKARHRGLRFLRQHQRVEAGENSVASSAPDENLPTLPPVRAAEPKPISSAAAQAREREKEVKRLYAEEGLTNAAIAEQIGTSRGAVGRILRRLGISSRNIRRGDKAVDSPTHIPVVDGKGVARDDKESNPAEAAAVSFEEVDAEAGVGLLGLKQVSCRWILGKTKAGVCRYCGQPVEVSVEQLRSRGQPTRGVIGTRYCPEHARRVRGRVLPRRDVVRASLARVVKV